MLRASWCDTVRSWWHHLHHIPAKNVCSESNHEETSGHAQCGTSYKTIGLDFSDRKESRCVWETIKTAIVVCICVCMCVGECVYVMCVVAYMCMCVYACVWVCVHVCMAGCMCVCAYRCVWMYACGCVHTHVCVYGCAVVGLSRHYFSDSSMHAKVPGDLVKMQDLIQKVGGWAWDCISKDTWGDGML